MTTPINIYTYAYGILLHVDAILSLGVVFHRR